MAQTYERLPGAEGGDRNNTEGWASDVDSSGAQRVPEPTTPDPYIEVRDWVNRSVGAAAARPSPAAGSPQWCALPDTHPQKFIAVLTAGTRWVLAERSAALKDAALVVSDAVDWAAVAHRVRQRDNAIRSGAYIPRRSE
ncbi:DUF2742 domain-containing protein [Gordonia jacobaea]|uniref:DUF2742 domain-containing protein n=1 Tax=Gordonia jacobaea TaxID=122202 RepID=UPI003D7113F6